MKTDPVRSFKSKTRANRNADLEDGLEPIKNFLEFVQTIFSIGLGLSTLMLLSGFIIVNSYLRRFTDVHAYNVSTGQYFAAGISFWAVGILFTAIIMFLNGFEFSEGRLRAPGTYQGFLLIDLMVNPTKLKKHLFKRGRSQEEAQNYIRQYRTPMIILSFIIVMGIGSAYGIFLYGTIDRQLGGGRPSTVILSLKPEYPALSLGLTSNLAGPNITTTVWLLAELTDGLLIADPNTGRVVAVRNDAIVAVIDDTVAESLIVPSATPTATPTATFTPVPTVTATP